MTSHRAPTRRPPGHGHNASRRILRPVLALASAVVVAVSGTLWWTGRSMLGDLRVSQALGTTAHPHADGPIDVLLIGLDSRRDLDGNDLPPAILNQLHAGDSESGGYNTNTLLLVHVNADDRVVAFSIPRDDYVAVSDVPGYGHIKIKEAYGLAKADAEERLVAAGDTDRADLERRGREAGRTATLAAVRDLTGVTPDYFAEVNLAGFYDLAAALGGVDVCLNAPVQDDYSGADFPAGRQRLDAAQTLAFVRQRHGLTKGDIDRTHRQQAFLVSVLDDLNRAGTFADLAKLGPLLDVVRRNVVLSAGWDTAMFARIGDIARTRAIEYHTLPVLRYDEIDGSDVNIVDAAAIKSQIRAATSAAAPPDGPTAPATTTVDVINASSVEGLAGRTSALLTARGFVGGETRSALPDDSSTTAIVYGPGTGQDATTIGDLVGIDSVSSDDRIPAGHVVVTLGPGYAPPVAGAPARPSSPTPATDAVTSGTGIPCVD
ncbi:LCP family protein [Mycolicibacterium grossiae]|uniref:Transcriptional regulator, LytR family protein n=1 Tax=Mycolicibacterium grossiae TaxID=1552759 RepID=A0A1E8QBQ8_9MYCO|nr:LCP family protein [Mycolicibacterium grossiae]OFJ55520.1 hypothetical protein BEL07_01005 [Mycolicibacterium grossiae]QEM45149.1 LytR family transcriptional regulator [Mycolicibacterium grossiae]